MEIMFQLYVPEQRFSNYPFLSRHSIYLLMSNENWMRIVHCVQYSLRKFLQATKQNSKFVKTIKKKTKKREN